MACVRYLRLNNLLFLHPPNEIMVRPQTDKFYRAVMSKRYLLGLEAGAPDIMILENNDYFFGMAIELKVRNNTPTLKQYDWLDRLAKRRWFSVWINDIDTFIFLVNHYRNTPCTIKALERTLHKGRYYSLHSEKIEHFNRLILSQIKKIN